MSITMTKATKNNGGKKILDRVRSSCMCAWQFLTVSRKVAGFCWEIKFLIKDKQGRKTFKKLAFLSVYLS